MKEHLFHAPTHCQFCAATRTNVLEGAECVEREEKTQGSIADILQTQRDILRTVRTTKREMDADRVRVLPMVEDYQKKRRQELVPWDHDSLRTTVRDATFKARLISYYGRGAPSEQNADGSEKKMILCQVLGVPIPSATVIGAHIWKFETKGRGLLEFGIPEGEIDNVRNGLLLCKNLEDAFDHMQVCFVYDLIQKVFFLHVSDNKLMNQCVYEAVTFQQIDNQPLRGLHLPYRRLLSWHAYVTLEKHGHMKAYSPFHRLSAVQPGYKFPEGMLSTMIQASATASDDEGDASEAASEAGDPFQ